MSLAVNCLDVLDRAAVELLHDHRGRRLADAAAVAVEEHLAEGAAVVDLQFHADHVAAEGIVVLVGVRAVRAVAAMVRILIVIEDMVLVKFFFVRAIVPLGEVQGRKSVAASPRNSARPRGTALRLPDPAPPGR